MDPDIDFAAIFAEFDTFLIGRRTFESMGKAGQGTSPGMTTVVFSRTLDPAAYPSVTVVSEGVSDVVNELKARDGKDIWLFGGGTLFRSLLERGLVDTVEVAVVPVLLGEGVALLAQPELRQSLVLMSHRVYDKSGIVAFEYSVEQSPA